MLTGKGISTIRRFIIALCIGVLLIGSDLMAGVSPSVEAWLRDAGPDDSIVVWVFFRDKGSLPASEVSARLREVAAGFEPEAVARRLKARPKEPFDEFDLPVYEPYVKALESEGVRFRAFSRWLNAASVETGRDEIDRIANLHFVSHIRRVSGRAGGPSPETYQLVGKQVETLDTYGYSWRQLEQIQVTALHTEGYTGTGVRVAIFDTGFWLEHESLLGVNVIAEHDFINDDDETANEPGDLAIQHRHGTQCLSLLAGRSPGILMGAAYDAEYVLAKTEDMSMEDPVEEDWWIEAAEWADSLGARVISSSLCYKDWYTYEDMDGDTAPITIAADRAVLNGIVVLNAAGNSGASAWKYILAPADGDSVISVGSVDSTGLRSYFSSVGPTYDGRIKPTIMAMGSATYIATTDSVSAYRRGSGTSFATPLSAGAIALILQKKPAWMPPEVIEAVMMTGTQASDPDTLYGWGILQAYDASNYVSSGVETYVEGVSPLVIWPNPCVAAFSVRCPPSPSVRVLDIYDVRGRLLGKMPLASSGFADIDLTSLSPVMTQGVVFIQVEGVGGAKVLILK